MQSFSLGVVPGGPVAELRPGDELCQGPIDVADDFARVTVILGTFMQSGPRLGVEVRDAAGGAVLTRGRLAAGYADNQEQEVRMSLVPEGSRVSVCVVNRGIRRVALYGGGDAAHLPSTASIDGTPANADVAIRFLYDRPRSLLRLAPEMVDRATLFAPGWLSSGLLWGLFALVALAVPGLLTFALARADGPPPPDPPDPPAD
jgi:hypothetical protein